MLTRVDAEQLIAAVRTFIETEYIDFARKRLDDETFPDTVRYIEGYRDASSQIARDISHQVYLAIVEQQKERGE